MDDEMLEKITRRLDELAQGACVYRWTRATAAYL
jgi:hypothetical protein